MPKYVIVVQVPSLGGRGGFALHSVVKSGVFEEWCCRSVEQSGLDRSEAANSRCYLGLNRGQLVEIPV